MNHPIPCKRQKRAIPTENSSASKLSRHWMVFLALANRFINEINEASFPGASVALTQAAAPASFPYSPWEKQGEETIHWGLKSLNARSSFRHWPLSASFSLRLTLFDPELLHPFHYGSEQLEYGTKISKYPMSAGASE